jgi:tetratricopeptide (TPR) repeat protein
MQCLEKDRTRRYETANALADDIERHLTHEPVEASPPSAAYLFRKFARRHRGGLLTGVAVALALVIGLGAATAGFAQAIRERDAKAEALAESKAVTDFLEATLSSVDPAKQGKDIRVHEILDQAAERIEQDEVIDAHPRLEARIRTVIGSTYAALELDLQAEPHLRRALDILEDELGTDAPATMEVLAELAGVLSSGLRRYEEAEPLWALHLDHSRRVHGELHPTTVWSVMNLGAVMTSRQRFDEAEPLLREALELSRQLTSLPTSTVCPPGAKPDPDTHVDYLFAMAQRSLAVWLVRSGGRVEKAELYANAAEAIFEENPESFARELAAVRLFMAGQVYRGLAYRRQDPSFLTKVEAYARSALEINEGIFGEGDPRTLGALYILAELHERRGDFDDALLFRQRLVVGNQRLKGPDHPGTLASTLKLAELSLRLGHVDDAEQHFAAVFERVTTPGVWDNYTHLLGTMGTSTSTRAFTPLFSIAVERGRFDDAAHLIDHLTGSISDDLDEATIHVRRLNAARATAVLARFDEDARASLQYRAIELYEQGIADMDAFWPDEPWRLVPQIYALARVFSDVGFHADAEALTAEANRRLASADLDLASTDNLVWAIVGNPEGNEDGYRAAFVMMQRALEGLPDRGGVDFCNTLGAALYRVGQYEEAIDTLLGCHAMRDRPAPEDWAFIAMAHFQLGRVDEARAALEEVNRLTYLPRFRVFVKEAERLLKSVDDVPGQMPP